jgi:hypothetical protein
MRRRLRLLVLLMALLAAAATACSPANVGPNPINPANRPTVPVGLQNGSLPASVLFTQGPSCRVWSQAAGSLVALMVAAHRAGVNLQPEECYRDFAGQVYERNLWCSLGHCENAAVPGTSNHGWGKAVDLRDQLGTVSWTSPGYRWLVANAGRFGWNHPGGVNEAWHWEWVGDGGQLHGYQIRPDLMSWPLREGAHGQAVSELQLALITHGVPVPSGIDGNFGASTTTAVKVFQQQHQLSVDGIVGQATAEALQMFS